MRFLIRLLLMTLSVYIAAYIFGRHVEVDGIFAALVFSLILAFFNVTLKPLLIILTIPATVLTLGFFLLVINALVVLAADYFVSGFYVNGFWWALLFSLVISVLSSWLNEQFGAKEKQ
ncbi:MAG: phage holin family protein [Bacteroidota bacterium]